MSRSVGADAAQLVEILGQAIRGVPVLPGSTLSARSLGRHLCRHPAPCRSQHLRGIAPCDRAILIEGRRKTSES